MAIGQYLQETPPDFFQNMPDGSGTQGVMGFLPGKSLGRLLLSLQMDIVEWPVHSRMFPMIAGAANM